MSSRRVETAATRPTERVRTHLTTALLRADLFDRHGRQRDIALCVEALGRALTAAVLERVRADELADQAAREVA